MQTLRDANTLTRWVLLWFVLAIGVALATPWISPKSAELVCTSGGALKLVVSGGGEGADGAMSSMDCPLCSTPGLPLPPAVSLPVVSPLAHGLQPLVAAHLAALTAAPLPARGPPSLSFLLI